MLNIFYIWIRTSCHKLYTPVHPNHKCHHQIIVALLFPRVDDLRYIIVFPTRHYDLAKDAQLLPKHALHSRLAIFRIAKRVRANKLF